MGARPALAADDPPQLDVNASCKAATQAYAGANAAQCLTQEQNARQALVAQWGGFSPGSRTECVRIMNSVAGTQSYVELLTCLQMAKDAGKLKD